MKLTLPKLKIGASINSQAILYGYDCFLSNLISNLHIIVTIDAIIVEQIIITNIFKKCIGKVKLIVKNTMQIHKIKKNNFMTNLLFLKCRDI